MAEVEEALRAPLLLSARPAKPDALRARPLEEPLRGRVRPRRPWRHDRGTPPRSTVDSRYARAFPSRAGAPGSPAPSATGALALRRSGRARHHGTGAASRSGCRGRAGSARAPRSSLPSRTRRRRARCGRPARSAPRRARPSPGTREAAPVPRRPRSNGIAPAPSRPARTSSSRPSPHSGAPAAPCDRRLPCASARSRRSSHRGRCRADRCGVSSRPSPRTLPQSRACPARGSRSDRAAGAGDRCARRGRSRRRWSWGSD